jgi:hypothetical protein
MLRDKRNDGADNRYLCRNYLIHESYDTNIRMAMPPRQIQPFALQGGFDRRRKK